jgi:hypothetical protein
VIDGRVCDVRLISERALAAGIDLEENEEVDTKMWQCTSQRWRGSNGESQSKDLRQGMAQLVIGRSNKGKGKHTKEKRGKLWAIVACLSQGQACKFIYVVWGSIYRSMLLQCLTQSSTKRWKQRG